MRLLWTINNNSNCSNSISIQFYDLSISHYSLPQCLYHCDYHVISWLNWATWISYIMLSERLLDFVSKFKPVIIFKIYSPLATFIFFLLSCYINIIRIINIIDIFMMIILLLLLWWESPFGGFNAVGCLLKWFMLLHVVVHFMF